MNRDEARALLRAIKALCPQQSVDEFTADLWHEMGLRRVDAADAMEALSRLVATQRFVALSDLLGTVKSLRESRIGRDVDLAQTPPKITPDESRAFALELRARNAQAASLLAGPDRAGGEPRRALAPPRPYVGAPGQPGHQPGPQHPEMASVHDLFAARTAERAAARRDTPQPGVTPGGPRPGHDEATLAAHRDACAQLAGRTDGGQGPLEAAAAELGGDVSPVLVAIRAAQLAATVPDVSPQETDDREAS